jgi:hypothetical protein
LLSPLSSSLDINSRRLSCDVDWDVDCDVDCDVDIFLEFACKFFSLVKAIRTWVFEFNLSLSQIFWD